MAGCALRMSTDPPLFASCLFYCRQTWACRPGEIPPQLVPQPMPMTLADQPPVPEATCHTMEVGAKSYADALSAIGSILAAVLPIMVMGS